jgi:hypothetical protein
LKKKRDEFLAKAKERFMPGKKEMKPVGILKQPSSKIESPEK